MTFSLAQLQEEMKPWVLHNFGERPTSQPLRGIVEEIGELSAAFYESDEAATQDGIADCLIFMTDYCNGRGYSMNDVVASARVADESFVWGGDVRDDAKGLLEILGKLCHHDLKKEQGIRKGEDHDKQILVQLGLLHLFLEVLCATKGWPSVNELVEKTWASVKLRDWKKNAVTG